MKSTIFGELNNFRDHIQENTKRMKFRRLRKTLELNQRELKENKHLEGTRRHHAKV
jgi:hypothetical protein